jgi:aldehyde dehydrogenase (NAD+)
LTELERKQDRAPVPSEWTYAPAPESRDVVTLRERYGLFIGGEWVAAQEHFTTISPRDESPLAEVGQASAADVETAVAAARDAFKSWSRLRGSER